MSQKVGLKIEGRRGELLAARSFLSFSCLLYQGQNLSLFDSELRSLSPTAFSKQFIELGVSGKTSCHKQKLEKGACHLTWRGWGRGGVQQSFIFSRA